MRAVVEIWLKSLIDDFTLGGLHSAMDEFSERSSFRKVQVLRKVQALKKVQALRKVQAEGKPSSVKVKFDNEVADKDYYGSNHLRRVGFQ